MSIPAPDMFYRSESRLLENQRSLKRYIIQLQNRRNEICRIATELDQSIDGFGEVEGFQKEWFDSSSLVAGTLEDIDDYITHAKEEHEKIAAGIKDYSALPESDAKTAFLNFMLADTDISMKNVGKVCEHYSRLVQSIRRIRKHIREEGE